MFRFLGPRAGSSCRLSSVIRARSLLQFSSFISWMCPCSSSSHRSLRAVLGQSRPVHCLRHAGITCEYSTLHKTNDGQFHLISVYRHIYHHSHTRHSHQVAGMVCSQSGTLSRTPSSASITGSFVREDRSLTTRAQGGDLAHGDMGHYCHVQCFFLAPSGAQGVAMSVCLSFSIFLALTQSSLDLILQRRKDGASECHVAPAQTT